MAELRTRSGADFLHALSRWIASRKQSAVLESRATACGARPAAIADTVVDDDNDGGVFLVVTESDRVDSSPLIGHVRRELAVVHVWATNADQAVVGEDALLPHDPLHARHQHAKTLVTERSPDCQVSFAAEGRRCERRFKLSEVRVVQKRLLAALCGNRKLCIRLRLDVCEAFHAWQSPSAAEVRDSVGLPAEGSVAWLKATSFAAECGGRP